MMNIDFDNKIIVYTETWGVNNVSYIWDNEYAGEDGKDGKLLPEKLTENEYWNILLWAEEISSYCEGTITESSIRDAIDEYLEEEGLR